MPTFPVNSAQEARKAVAARLVDLRRDAGFSTARQVAAAAGWYPSKVSRIESGTTRPSEQDIETWCRICGAADQAADIIADTRHVDQMYVEWRRVQRTGLKRLQESRVPIYERTLLFRIYCSNVIPGLIQTPAYATALLTQIADFHDTPNDVEEAVAARVERARILRGSRRFAFLVEESVLRHRIGDAAAMAGQLGHLLAVMSLPAVSLGVIPLSAERRMWPIETFQIYDEDMVSVELLTAAVTVNAPSQVKQYVEAFRWLAERAAYGADARALITSAISALG